MGSGSLIKKKKKVSFKNSYDKYANCYVCSVTCRMRLESLQFLYAICFESRKMITVRAFLESLEDVFFLTMLIKTSIEQKGESRFSVLWLVSPNSAVKS